MRWSKGSKRGLGVATGRQKKGEERIAVTKQATVHSRRLIDKKQGGGGRIQIGTGGNRIKKEMLLLVR